MRILNPDTLEWVPGEELVARQKVTGEIGDGKHVYCIPDPINHPMSMQTVGRAVCLRSPYPACLSCPHHNFEFIFEAPEIDEWVACPRWKGELNGTPDFYSIVRVSECHAKPFMFCGQCPSREELVQLSTDKKKMGWLERYRKLTKED